MKNLLEDPEVLQLYKALQAKRIESVEDYLTSSPVEDFFEPEIPKIKPQQDRKIFFDGVEVQDFEGDNDYGL